MEQKTIRHYTCNYDSYDAEVCFKVDTEIFTVDIAKEYLEFFVWSYDKLKDPIDELIKKYAIKAILIATAENYNKNGVKNWFEEQEGYPSMDGTQGIELNFINAYEFEEEKLEITIITT